MSSTAATSRWRGVQRAMARPGEPVARTRRLFFGISLVSLLITAPVALGGSAGTVGHLLLAGSCLALAVSWTHCYRTGAVLPVFDVLDAVAVMAFALACPQPAVAYNIVFPAMWFRVLYGRTGRVGAYAAGLGAALCVATLAWGVVPGHAGGTATAPVVGALPVLALTFVGARHLALGMLEREQTRGRDAVLRDLGTDLLGLSDPVQIRAVGWRAVERICEESPGLRVVVVADPGAGPLHVVERTGGFAQELSTLPRGVLDGDPTELTDAGPLAAAAGFTGHWVPLPLPDFPGHDGLFPGSCMLVGAPDGVPGAAVQALESLNNQVTLAMRSSQAHRDLATQARTDSLTGLANRAAFTTALDLATAASTGRTWVLFLDLDDFKAVNDGLGHAAGDELLQHAAARMLGSLREDDLCARFGGDEFGVLLRDADAHQARTISERLVELIAAPVTLEGRLTRVGASGGLACVEPRSTGTEVVQRADVAMYAAKAAGKNRVEVFSPALLVVPDTAVLAAEMRRSVEEGRFVVHYQPIVSTIDGRCLAVESLVRWDHPVRGLLSPADFLDVAEETGVVIAIGEQVLRQACAEAAGWTGLGAEVAVHVNASPSQLGHPHFVTAVRDCLAEHSLAPERLIIEITESTVLDSPVVQRTLQVLSGLGVGVALDDFGTGYSALTTLRTLPVDLVKIDKSFVAGAVTTGADQAVIEAIAHMAWRLGLDIVAEGVETAEQEEYLRRLGITAVQGYLHQRPVPADVFAAWLAAQHPVEPVVV